MRAAEKQAGWRLLGPLADKGLRGGAAGVRLEGMRSWVRAALATVALAGAVVALQAKPAPRAAAKTAKSKAACVAPTDGDAPITYTNVEPIFAAKCATCHDARKSDNAAPQRVFEMSSYPFSTARPTTLVADLRHMFEVRGSLTADEKCLGLAWIAGGARDAEGNLPRWRE